MLYRGLEKEPEGLIDVKKQGFYSAMLQ